MKKKLDKLNTEIITPEELSETHFRTLVILLTGVSRLIGRKKILNSYKYIYLIFEGGYAGIERRNIEIQLLEINEQKIMEEIFRRWERKL